MGREGEMPMDSTSASTATRPSLKSHSHSHSHFNWKHKLRENCYKRVREDRNRLLWRLRTTTTTTTTTTTHPASEPPCNQQQVDTVRSALQDIVSDEFRKIKHNSTHIPLPDSHMDMDEILWEYDGVHSCYDGQCEDILLEMQRIFYEDLNSQPPLLQQDLESGIDTWEDEVDKYLACAVYEHMQLNEDKVHREEIWCPICKQGALKEDHNLIYCTQCELKLNKADEDPTMWERNSPAETGN